MDRKYDYRKGGSRIIFGVDMRIAICEDKKEHAEILESMIRRWAAKENLKVDIGYYQSAEQFLFFMKMFLYCSFFFCLQRQNMTVNLKCCCTSPCYRL